jgi:cytoskeleton protein RodZ
MTPIGEALRRERLRRNLDLEQISRELKIAPRFLEAIEQEKFDRLPGHVFAKSFVRQYAGLLGLDAEELAAEVQRQFEPPPEAPAAGTRAPAAAPIQMPRMAKWETVGDRRASWASSLPALAMVVIVMLGCAGLYTWWQRSRRPAPAPAQIAQAVKQAPPSTPASAPVQQPQPQPQQQPADTAAGPVTPAPGKPAAADVGSADRQPANAPAESAAPVESGAPEKPEQQAAEVPPAQDTNAPVQVELTAQEPVWVRAQSDGRYLFARTLQPNESRKVDAEKEVQLRLGNAGAVTILLNGKPIGPVGSKGQIRTLQFTPGGFKIVSAPNPGVFDPF